MGRTPFLLNAGHHRWLWQGFGFVWGTILLGLFFSMIANMLKPEDILRWVNQSLLIGLPISIRFLTPPILVGLTKHRSSSQLAQSASLAQTQLCCAAFVRALSWSAKELAQSLRESASMALQLHEKFETRRPLYDDIHHNGSNPEHPSVFSISIPFSLH